MGVFVRVGFPFRDRARYLKALAQLVVDAGPVPDVGAIPYCDDGAELVGLPEEIASLRCASCVLLSLYAATLAYQAGSRVDLCCSALDVDTEHAWIRVDGRLRDPSADGGLRVPSGTYRGAVIVPVE